MNIAKLHDWNVTPKEAVSLQRSLADQILLKPKEGEFKHVAGVDISCMRGDKRLFAAVVMMKLPTLEIIEICSSIEEAAYPYISGLLAFREIPALLKAFEKLKTQPDVVLCDGQGIAHPRRMGLASHLGLWLNIPTIGCAKTRLVGDFEEPAGEKGSTKKLSYKNDVVGCVYRSKRNVKPLFISPGHLIDFEGSLQVVQQCVKGYRLPEPTRQAHLAVNRVRVENPL